MKESDVSFGRVNRLLLGSFCILWVVHLVSTILLLVAKQPLNRRLLHFLVFDGYLGAPFFFSIFLFLCCAILMAANGRQARTTGDAAICWWGGAMGCAVVPIMMIIGVRRTTEYLVAIALQFPKTSVVFIVTGVTAAWLLLRSVWCLPPLTRRRLMMSGSLYLLGAVGLELLSVYYYGRRSEPGVRFIYVSVSTLEESCEMLGLILAIRAARLHNAGV